ncbi:MAG TPA: hypothetical protein VF234_08245 [Limnochordia bacterium]
MPKPLIDLYWERFSEAPLDLEEFLDEVHAGRYGSFTADEIIAFIESVEEMTLQNIDVKAREGPHFEQRREAVIEETRERMRSLVDKYGKDVKG